MERLVPPTFRTILGAALGIGLATGCSFFGPRRQTLTVSSDPPGAQLFINGERVGETPLQHRVQRGQDLLIELRKPGYETAYHTTHRTLSTLGILDAAGAAVILVPIVGLLSGAAWKHDPAVVGITLQRDADAPASPRR